MKTWGVVSLLLLPSSPCRRWRGARLTPHRRCSSWTSPPPPASSSCTTADAPGKKFLPETHGLRRRVRRRRTATAGPTSSSSTAATGRRSGQAIAARALPQQRQRHVHERHGRQRPRRRDVRHGRRRRRLRQRRPRRSLRHRARRRPPVPQRRQRQVPRRDEGGRHRQRELRHERGVARLRQRRQARSLRRQLRPVDAADRPLLLARRHHEVVLHARVVQGHRVEAVSQPRRRASSRTSARRPASAIPTSKSLGVAVLDYDVRRLARPLRRQRHAAEQAVSQQPQRHVHREGRGGRRGVQRGRRGARRDGRRCRRLRSLGPPAPARRQLLEPDARPLSQRGQRPVRGRGADAPPSGRASLLSLAFGVFFFDYDLDGSPDIFAANGHIEEEIGRVQPKVQYQAAAAAVPQPRARASSSTSSAVARARVQRAAGRRAARRTPTTIATATSTS